MKLVNCEDVVSIAHNYHSEFDMGLADLNDLKEVLYDTPTIEAKPVVHAHWVKYWNTYYMSNMYCCSKCGNNALTREETMFDQILTEFCPYCGAQMDEVASDTNVGSKTNKPFSQTHEKGGCCKNCTDHIAEAGKKEDEND